MNLLLLLFVLYVSFVHIHLICVRAIVILSKLLHLQPFYLAKLMSLHKDSKFSSSDGVTYVVSFTGIVPLKCSMNEFDFGTRCAVINHCLALVRQQRGLTGGGLSNSADESLHQLCGALTLTETSNVRVNASTNLSHLTLRSVATSKTVHQFDLSDISYVYNDDDSSFAVLVVNDVTLGRVCVLLECTTSERARCVTSTLGQAFHLAAQRAAAQPSTSASTATADQPTTQSSVQSKASHHSTHSKSISKVPVYYNYMPGKELPETEFEVLSQTQSLKLVDSLFASSFKEEEESPTLMQHELSSCEYVSLNGSSNVSEISFLGDVCPKTRSVKFTNKVKVKYYKRETELDEQCWFHGKLSRLESEGLVLEDGDFLVRCSPDIEDQFVLTGRENGHVRHILLMDEDNQVRNHVGVVYPSVTQFIVHHRCGQIPIVSANGVQLYLKRPIMVNRDSN